VRASRGGRLLRALGVAAVVVLVLLGVARVVLERVVSDRTRKALNESPDQRAAFSEVVVSLLHLSYGIHDLRIEKKDPGLGWVRFLEVRRLDSGLYWSELVRGHLVGALLLDRPKLTMFASPVEKREPKKPPSQRPEDVGIVLQKFVPFRLDRAEVRSGELLWVDAKVPERPRLWFHGVDGTLENFSSRAALSRGEPTVLALSGTLQKTGRVSIYASADPLAKGLTFAGSARLSGLRLAELGELLAATADFTPDRGTLDVSARFKAENGWLTGGVRPVLRDAGLRQAKPGLGAKIKSVLADAALQILSDRVPGRNAVATTIPIHGDLRNPDVKLWPTLFGVVRNAFVSGLADTLEGLPPPSAGAGSKEQARRPPQREARAGTQGDGR
jgi:Domain of Unknown Function (DUF748)